VLLIGLLAASPLPAQVPRSGGGESQQFMLQYQQIAAERTQLKAQIAQMQKDLDAAKSDLAAAKKERDALKGRTGAAAEAIARANADKTAADQATEQVKRQSSELVAKFRETAVTLRQTEADRATLQRQLAERNAAFDQCALANVNLYDLTNQVLDRYEHVGLFTKVAATEPFTKITRARIDNLVDDYRARAQELKLKERPRPPDPASAPSPASGH
jgi:chromosome segregation ATPase